MGFNWFINLYCDTLFDKKCFKRLNFYEGTKRRGFVFNGLARLWWAGRYTYDKGRENPFEIMNH